MTYTDGVHLIADSVEELHRFAAGIGLRRAWFQGHPRHPHYDLTTPRKRNQAVRHGARRVTSREIVKILRKRGE